MYSFDNGETRPHRRKDMQRQLETLFREVVMTRVGYSTQKRKFLHPTAQSGSESTSNLLVLTTYGKGIVMHSQDLGEATAKVVEKATQSRQTRLRPGQKQQRKQIATVVLVYNAPRFEHRPEDITSGKRNPPSSLVISNKRVWADIRQEAKPVIGSAFAEAARCDLED